MVIQLMYCTCSWNTPKPPRHGYYPAPVNLCPTPNPLRGHNWYCCTLPQSFPPSRLLLLDSPAMAPLHLYSCVGQGVTEYGCRT
jgi:hypothetical protein